MEHLNIGAGGKPLMERPYIKSRMINIGCDSKVIQFVTVISYKINEEDTFFSIYKNTPNYTFILKSPLFNSNKEWSNSLGCKTYAINYSECYYVNITVKKALPEGLWTLRVTRYVTKYVSIWNNWFHYQTIEGFIFL